jgi:hypothetical protein
VARVHIDGVIHVRIELDGDVLLDDGHLTLV